jgi:predicted ATPase
MLQSASVLGRFFEYRALAAIGAETAEMDRTLAQLLRAELIRDWARLPDRQYVFRHALTQEAAYASLTAGPRKALHAKTARHLEETLGAGTSEHAAVLAHHWYAAEDWARALAHTLTAAERARALYARPEAVSHYWRAQPAVGADGVRDALAGAAPSRQDGRRRARDGRRLGGGSDRGGASRSGSPALRRA